MKTTASYHLTSAHRNRQCFGQTGVLVSADGDSPNAQYQSSRAYRLATTLSDGDVIYSRSHLSCPVAVANIRGLTPGAHGAYTGQWELCSQVVANLLPTDYPSLEGYYVMVAFGGEHRVPFRLLPGANTRIFHAEPTMSWISSISGVSSLLGDATTWFPSQPITLTQLQEIIAAHNGPDIQHPCHVLRAAPAILLDSGAANIHMEWVSTDSTLLRVLVQHHAGIGSLQYLADLVRSDQPSLLHIGGTLGALDGADVCSSNIYGVDLATGPDYVAFHVTARLGGALTGALVPTSNGGHLGAWGPLCPSGGESFHDTQRGAVVMLDALTAPSFRGTLIGQLIVLRFTLTEWAAGDILLSYVDGNDVWSLAWGYPDGVVGSSHAGVELWITLPDGGVAQPLLLQPNLLHHSSPFLSNVQLATQPCEITLALLVDAGNGMVTWMWSGYDVVGGVAHASTNGTVSVQGTDGQWRAAVQTREIRSQGYSGLVMGKNEGVAYHDVRVYATGSIAMATEHEWMRTQAGAGGGTITASPAAPTITVSPAAPTITTTTTIASPDIPTPPQQWQLVLRLGKASSPPAMPLPHTTYIEGWSAVQTPIYGPGFAMNKVVSVRQRVRQQTVQQVVIDVRLLYVTLPAMAIMRISKRPLLRIPAWWIAVRLSEPLMSHYIDDSSAMVTLRPSNPYTVPSWVSSRGTLFYRAQFDRYTSGVTVALQLACPTPLARLHLQSTALQQASVGLPRVCIFAVDGEVLDLVPLIGGGDIPIEGGPALSDDIAYVGLQIETTAAG